MKKTNDSGQAFPGIVRIVTVDGTMDFAKDKGMTLRQWYAGIGLVVQGIINWRANPADLTDSGAPNDFARGAFRIADAMIAYEQKEGEK